jgi:hypothetical protein
MSSGIYMFFYINILSSNYYFFSFCIFSREPNSLKKGDRIIESLFDSVRNVLKSSIIEVLLLTFTVVRDPYREYHVINIHRSMVIIVSGNARVL